jgi:hypothetical protein
MIDRMKSLTLASNLLCTQSTLIHLNEHYENLRGSGCVDIYVPLTFSSELHAPAALPTRIKSRVLIEQKTGRTPDDF